MRWAFTAGQRLMQLQKHWRSLAAAVRSSRSGHSGAGLGFRLAVGQNARQRRNFGNPTAVILALTFNLKHGLLHRLLYRAPVDGATRKTVG